MIKRFHITIPTRAMLVLGHDAVLRCSLAKIEVQGLGAVTIGQERASRAPVPWLPDQTLNPNLGSLQLRILCASYPKTLRP